MANKTEVNRTEFYAFNVTYGSHEGVELYSRGEDRFKLEYSFYSLNPKVRAKNLLKRLIKLNVCELKTIACPPRNTFQDISQERFEIQNLEAEFLREKGIEIDVLEV